MIVKITAPAHGYVYPALVSPNCEPVKIAFVVAETHTVKVSNNVVNFDDKVILTFATSKAANAEYDAYKLSVANMQEVYKVSDSVITVYVTNQYLYTNLESPEMLWK